MSAAEALRAAHAAGVTVKLDGECLLLEAAAAPPQTMLGALARHKLAILSLLRPGQCGWITDHWRTYFDKRCSIEASNGGRPRAEAEALALACCVAEWLNQHPAPSPSGCCAWCGKGESPGAAVLPFGTEPAAHAWLHAECWSDWHRARQADAIAALAAMGIPMRDENCGRNQENPT
jgi:hypothetical protein